MDVAVQRQNDNWKTVITGGAWAGLFTVCVIAYFPGLAGPFVFDDFGSIADLGNLGGVTDWTTFKAFVFGGHTGPTGRPISLLSFLIDANNWPTDPWPLKRTNLIIHMINGALLGWLTAKILALLDVDKQDARWIALLSAACWLLHPFLVSTTLYVVQRMAQLSTLFIFSGLGAYLYFRSVNSSNAAKGYVGMTLSVALFTVLATFSKENGILLPLLIGVIEITVFASRPMHLNSLNRYWSLVFIVLPSVIIALYLGEKFFSDNFFVVVPPRDFSMYERLLTESRILVDYLKHWYVPELYTTGVFQDHFIKSSGIISPVSTLISALLHVAIITIALMKRRKWPLVALAVLFFYGSHLLESSVVSLELYFEHRNYLAAAFLALPLIASLQRKVERQLFFAVAAGVVVLLAGFTRYSASIWQDYPSMVEASARKAPTSARAQSQYSINLYNEQQYDESLQVIDRAIENIPDNSSLLITRSTILCHTGALTAREFEQAANVLSSTLYDPRLLQLYTTLSTSVADQKCPDVSMGALRTMYENMLTVPENGDPKSLQYSQIKYFSGFVEVRAGEPSEAVKAFDESLQSRPGAGHAMNMAAVLATSNYFDEALYFSGIALEQLEAEPNGVFEATGVNKSDVMEFRANIRAEMDARQQDDGNDHPVP